MRKLIGDAFDDIGCFFALCDFDYIGMLFAKCAATIDPNRMED